LNGNATGILTQTVATVPGQHYRLEFDLAGNPDSGPALKSLLVSAGDQSEIFSFDAASSSRSAMGWTSKRFVFTATGEQTTVSFASLNPGAYGPAIDNVSLQPADVDVGVRATGLSIRRVVCRNRTSGQAPVVIDRPAALDVNCEEAGLHVNEGDRISITVHGVASSANDAPDQELPGGPAVAFTEVPPYGSFSNLKGQVSGVEFDQHNVAVVIRVRGGWWTKPYWATPTTPISADGSFETDVTTGGVDQEATDIVAYLVPTGFNPPLMSGQLTLPASLDEAAVAKIQVSRNLP
jgi:hypothetical protein